MVSGWTIGLVGGVENMGVAGESIVVGPDMVGTGGYCKCWSLLQVLLYLYGSMFNLILGTTGDGDGEKMENSRHASSRRREGNSSTSGSLTAIAFRIISHWLSDVQSSTCPRPPSLCSLILLNQLLHIRHFSHCEYVRLDLINTTGFRSCQQATNFWLLIVAGLPRALAIWPIQTLQPTAYLSFISEECAPLVEYSNSAHFLWVHLHGISKSFLPPSSNGSSSITYDRYVSLRPLLLFAVQRSTFNVRPELGPHDDILLVASGDCRTGSCTRKHCLSLSALARFVDSCLRASNFTSGSSGSTSWNL